MSPILPLQLLLFGIRSPFCFLPLQTLFFDWFRLFWNRRLRDDKLSWPKLDRRPSLVQSTYKIGDTCFVLRPKIRIMNSTETERNLAIFKKYRNDDLPFVKRVGNLVHRRSRSRSLSSSATVTRT
jgi:hypothetical protein